MLSSSLKLRYARGYIREIISSHRGNGDVMFPLLSYPHQLHTKKEGVGNT